MTNEKATKTDIGVIKHRLLDIAEVATFEPNTPEVRKRVRQRMARYLRTIAPDPIEVTIVCDRTNNPKSVVRDHRLLATARGYGGCDLDIEVRTSRLTET